MTGLRRPGRPLRQPRKPGHVAAGRQVEDLIPDGDAHGRRPLRLGPAEDTVGKVLNREIGVPGQKPPRKHAWGRGSRSRLASPGVQQVKASRSPIGSVNEQEPNDTTPKRRASRNASKSVEPMALPGDAAFIDLKCLGRSLLQQPGCIGLLHADSEESGGEKEIEKAEHQAGWTIGGVGQAVLCPQRVMQAGGGLEWEAGVNAAAQESNQVAGGGKGISGDPAGPHLGASAQPANRGKELAGVAVDGNLDIGLQGAGYPVHDLLDATHRGSFYFDGIGEKGRAESAGG